MAQNTPASPIRERAELEKSLRTRLASADETLKSILLEALSGLLAKAAVGEHLLSMQYLFASFSMKKYLEEFDDYHPNPAPNDPRQEKINHLRLAQLEAIRRWNARVLFVARQEMTHLAFVQNLYAILGDEPYLFRPNFPVPASAYPFGKPLNLMPFSRHALEIFRYWEKPDTVHLPDPFRLKEVPQAIRELAGEVPHPEKAEPTDPEQARYEALQYMEKLVREKDAIRPGSVAEAYRPEVKSIEQLYAYIGLFFDLLLDLRFIEGKNLDRIVNEHYGFNIEMEPIVDGKYKDYVQKVIAQIIEEGEGVGGVPPPLGSHFWVYQTLLEELNALEAQGEGLPFDPSLPVVFNPTTSTTAAHHLVPVPENGQSAEAYTVYPVTNPVAIKAMGLFNDAYNVLINMLFGFFNSYSIDQTTGIRPPHVNAFFRTSFYPFMTMVIRPLGEMLCRLPADATYVPDPAHRVPPRTAGPNFFFAVGHGPGHEQARKDATKNLQSEEDFIKRFEDMAGLADELAQDCLAYHYHMANYDQPDARDFDARFTYLAENFRRIAKNFKAYWDGNMIAPIPSKGFENFPNTFN